MNKTSVHMDNVSVYYGQTPAITGVCLDVSGGEYLGIIGPNGGGKSTLLKAILGLVPITSGTVEVCGRAVKSGSTGIGYVPQFADMEKNAPISVTEVVLTGRLRPGLNPFFRFTKEDGELSCSLIEKVGLSHLKDRRVRELSGGEYQRMLIARALATEPGLLLLDEPTASVDAAARVQIYELLEELNKSMTIILVTHDLLAISSHVHRLACLNRTLVYHGDPEFNEDVVNSLYGCPVDLIAHGVPHRVLREHGEDESK